MYTYFRKKENQVKFRSKEISPCHSKLYIIKIASKFDKYKALVFFNKFVYKNF